jgi:hypothetical protein
MNSFTNPVIRARWHNLNDYYGEALYLFRNAGCLIGIVYSVIRYRTPHLLIIYWCILLASQALLHLFSKRIPFFHGSVKPRREQLIFDAADAACFCLEKINWNGSIDEVTVGIFTDSLDKILKYFPNGIDPSSEYNTRLISRLIEIGKLITRFKNRTNKDTCCVCASEHSNPGNECLAASRHHKAGGTV